MDSSFAYSFLHFYGCRYGYHAHALWKWYDWNPILRRLFYRADYIPPHSYLVTLVSEQDDNSLIKCAGVLITPMHVLSSLSCIKMRVSFTINFPDCIISLSLHLRAREMIFFHTLAPATREREMKRRRYNFSTSETPEIFVNMNCSEEPWGPWPLYIFFFRATVNSGQLVALFLDKKEDANELFPFESVSSLTWL